MSSCSRCGNPIEFRYIDGKCIPLHLHGECTGYRSVAVTDYAGQNSCNESVCFSTNCPQCGEKVHFIRHNGGSVWIDSPLGPPWFKHACFASSASSKGRRSLAQEFGGDTGQLNTEGLLLGVVKSTNVNFDRTHTKVLVECGEYEKLSLGIKNNAGYLLGKLCVIEEKSSLIWPIESSDYPFKILHLKKVSTEPAKCPDCGVEVLAKNLNKHRRKYHKDRQ